MLNIEEPQIIDSTQEEERLMAILADNGMIDAIADRYLNGGCLAFAYALWLAHGKPADGSISILSNDFGEGHGDIDHEATHAYFETPQMDIDVRGVRNPSAMATDLDVDYWSIAETMSPEDAVLTYAGGFHHQVEEGDFPLELREDDFIDALVHIANHPERYGLCE